MTMTRSGEIPYEDKVGHLTGTTPMQYHMLSTVNHTQLHPGHTFRQYTNHQQHYFTYQRTDTNTQDDVALAADTKYA